MKLIRLIDWLWRVPIACYQAWRDVIELSWPYGYDDVSFPDLPLGGTNNEGPLSPIPRSAGLAECGRCCYCDSASWYTVCYTSAGWPVTVYLCQSCYWCLLQSSPHLHMARISTARQKWLRQHFPERYK